MKIKYDELLSSFAFNWDVRRYNAAVGVEVISLDDAPR